MAMACHNPRKMLVLSPCIGVNVCQVFLIRPVHQPEEACAHLAFKGQTLCSHAKCLQTKLYPQHLCICAANLGCQVLKTRPSEISMLLRSSYVSVWYGFFFGSPGADGDTMDSKF